MAYYNFEIASLRGFSPQHIISLQLIKQNSSDSLCDLIESTLGIGGIKGFEEKGIIEYTKPKRKTDTVFQLVRLSKSGKELLEDLQVPEILEEDLTIFNYLANNYKTSEKKIGNQKKCKLYIALFRVHSGISRNKMAVLCNEFLNDTDNFQYSQVLEYLLFRGSNPYERFDINQSRLYQYYQNKEEYFLNLFRKYD